VSSQPPVSGPDAVLSFTVQGNIMTSNWIAPTLTIDGYPVAAPITGSRRVPIWSGRHHLRAHSQWLWNYGHAAIDIDVLPGQTLEVFYAPPHRNTIKDGSMGLRPQRRKGRGSFIGTWVVLGLLAIATVGLALGTLTMTILAAIDLA
jgi:hypothetical protein